MLSILLVMFAPQMYICADESKRTKAKPKNPFRLPKNMAGVISEKQLKSFGFCGHNARYVRERWGLGYTFCWKWIIARL
jgi:hypothetical protein